MPCSCDGPDEKIELRQLADAATRAACDLRTILRRGGKMTDLTQETLAWVAQHDLKDAARIRREEEEGIREQTRTKALKKLNLDERRVLGL